MKKDIHPKLFKDCEVTCVCGNAFTTISTIPSIHVEICSNCHPFFTGQQKFVDTEGRVDKFHKKAKQIEETKQKYEARKYKKSSKTEQTKQTKPITLKELMKQMKEDEKSPASESTDQQ
ncbi:50S ribosomal protein L31 [candidate division WWE3 bacterium]|jgi:large subunit ribosomal protein L31|uniref:Large ribosomal subunit protein bL31 n=1 Tax=candidate division WWE3 bacterium TaxID=2053526 RepID=A0A3A4ZDK2_UNCKA|nr:MAG: 50S ribosomal protein L31 [candidate division WWE3 bacterium]